MLYIQLDNCSDNKARIVLAYLADLVRRRIVRRIVVSTLLRGHTHIDIDQWFGVFSRALTRDEALTLPAYARVLRAAFKDAMNAPEHIEIVTHINDWDTYYGPCIDNQLAGHCNSEASGNATHQFVFELNYQGRSVMYYKQFMTSREERPQPLQLGNRWKPVSTAAATAAFGERWVTLDNDTQAKVVSDGVEVGAGEFAPGERVWHIPLIGFDGVELKLASPGIELLTSFPSGVPPVAATPTQWYESSEGSSAEFDALRRTIDGAKSQTGSSRPVSRSTSILKLR